MAAGNNGRGTSHTHVVLLFVSIFATAFVGERLLQLTREMSYLESQLQDAKSERYLIQKTLDDAGVTDLSQLKNLMKESCGKSSPEKDGDGLVEVPFVNVQPAHLEDLPIAQNKPRIDDEDVQTVGADADDLRMPPILGQVDLIEDGFITGWACQKGFPTLGPKGGAAHPLVDRICAGPANVGADGAQRNVVFKFRLPRLNEGIYNLRAFVYSADHQWRKELNSSPQRFAESSSHPGLSDAVKRKDAIIRARNAQVAALYEQLHSRGIWTKVTNFERVRTFNETKNNNKYLAFVGLISNPNDIHSRDLQRQAWFPKGDAIERTATEKGIILRFVIGKSDWMTEKEMEDIRNEMKKHGDILIVDMRGFEDPAKKTLAFFSAVAFEYDVDFVFKAEKDTVIDIDALSAYVKPLRGQGNLYLGCMKSGEVVRSARQKWHEPEHWKFGDAQGSDRKANYPRHANRQLLGVSQLVARYLAQNADVMHFYANDDVSVGVWLLGLDVEYRHESRLCCLPKSCNKVGDNVDNRCIGYFEPSCSGVCRADITIGAITKRCLQPRQ